MRSIPCAALVLAACHTSTTPAPPASPENVAPERLALGYVLVTQGAWLRTAPDATAAGAHGDPLEGEPTDDANLENLWGMRQTADAGAWVEVENLTWREADPHCYGSIGWLDSYKLRLHVRRDDLVAVTPREVEAWFDDGSGVTLSAGVAMYREGDRFRIGVDAVHPVLAIEPQDVGTYYLAPTGHLDTDLDLPFREMPPGPFIVDGQSIELPYRVMDKAVIEDGPDPAHHLVTASLTCSRYHGLVERTELGVGRGEPGYGYGTIGTAGNYDRPTVRAGAALTWPDGTPAGETIHRVDILWVGDRLDDRICFAIPLRARQDIPENATGDEDFFLTVCAHEADWSAGFTN